MRTIIIVLTMLFSGFAFAEGLNQAGGEGPGYGQMNKGAGGGMNNRGMGKRRRGGRQGGQLKMLQQLNLTDDQMTKLADLKRDDMSKMRDLKTKIGNYRSEMQTLMTEDKLDEKKISILIEQISKGTADMMHFKLSSAKKLRTILKPDQVKQLNLMMLMGGGQGGKSFNRGEKSGGRRGARGMRGGRRGNRQSQGHNQNQGN